LDNISISLVYPKDINITYPQKYPQRDKQEKETSQILNQVIYSSSRPMIRTSRMLKVGEGGERTKLSSTVIPLTNYASFFQNTYHQRYLNV
jgi:hypothetical protein